MKSFTSFILNFLIKSSNQRLIIPFYHAVCDSVPNFTRNLYTPRNIEDFKKDLDSLLELYEPISLVELIELSNSDKKIKKNYFHLTFDDGLANFYEIVAPILVNKKISATVFVNTNFVDNKELFYRYKASLLLNFYSNSSSDIRGKFHNFIGGEDNSKEKVTSFLLNISFKKRVELAKLASYVEYDFQEFLKEEKPYLSKKQISILVGQGFTFGAHSLNHPYYSELSLDDQIKQTTSSLHWIESELNINYKVFSFPFTDQGVSSKFFTHIYSINQVDLSFGTAGIKEDEESNHIQRIDFEIGNKKLKPYLLKEYLRYYLKVFINKHIVHRK